jgi:hypothetical protein
MVNEFSPVGVVDVVWTAAGDGRWHARRRIAEEVPFEAEEVTAALDFLVRYGFAQSSPLDGKRFKIVMGGPSPMEAAKILRAMASRGNPGSSHYS